jgi:SagB-type dehydrogenase family enzyme
MKVIRLSFWWLTLLVAIACSCSSPPSMPPTAAPAPSVAPPAVTAPASPSVSPPVTVPIPSLPDSITLPEPRFESQVSLEETLLGRRSVREYADLPLSLEDVSQLLWAAQGITSDWGGRTAPSAGALYPLEVYLVVGSVDDLGVGVYKYQPQEHALFRVGDGDVRAELASAALGQSFVDEAAVDIVIGAVYERTTRKYGDRGVRYVHMEAGHAAQNIYLEAVALDLGTVTIGAFSDELVMDILDMPESEVPLYIMPVGRKQA